MRLPEGGPLASLIPGMRAGIQCRDTTGGRCTKDSTAVSMRKDGWRVIGREKMRGRDNEQYKKLSSEEKYLLLLYRGLDSRGRNAVMGTARHEHEYGGRNYERQGRDDEQI